MPEAWTDLGTVAPPKAPPKPAPENWSDLGTPARYEPTTRFRADMDKDLGAHAWQDTGDYRTPTREDQLRRQGAQTARGVSEHSQGTPDAPGAHDIVVSGETPQQTAARLRKAGYKGALIPEGPAGGQGAHLHVGAEEDWSDLGTVTPAQDWRDLGAPAKPALPPKPTTPPKPATAAPAPRMNPIQEIGHNFAEDYRRTIAENTAAVGQDFSHQAQRERTDPFGSHPDLSTGKTALDLAQYALTPIQSAARTIIGRPVETGTGGRVSHETAGDVASMVLPVAEGVRGAAALERAAKAAGLTVEEFRATQAGQKAVRAATQGPGEVSRAVSGASRTVRNIVSPATVSQIARDAAALHRSVLGKWGITSDRESYLLAKNARALRNLTPAQRTAFIDYVERRSSGARPPDAPSHDVGPGAEYGPARAPQTPMERARAKTVGRIEDMAEDTPLRQAADAIRDMSDRYKARIQYRLGTEEEGGPRFVKDYYARLWKEKPGQVETAMSGFSGKQGSGRSLRQRTIPTYAEGIARGLTPRFPNPIDAMTVYNETMANFLATHEIKDAMVEAGGRGKDYGAYWAFPGKQKPGDAPLKGMLTERQPRGGKGGRPGKTTMTFNPGAPRIEDKGPGGATWTAETGDEVPKAIAQPGAERTNVTTPDRPSTPKGQRALPPGQEQLQLEDATSKARKIAPGEPEPPTRKPKDRPPLKEQLYAHPDAARIYNNHISHGLDQGDIGPIYRGARAAVNGLVQLKLGLSAFHAAVMSQEGIVSEVGKGIGQLSRGKIAEGAKSILSSPAAPVRLAARGSRMRMEILGEKPPSEFDARLNDIYERAGGQLSMSRIYSPRASGSFFTSLTRGTFARDVKDSLRRIIGPNPSTFDRAAGIIDTTGNLIQSAAAPIFEQFVPATKRGAWAGRMETFLRENPAASEDDVVRKGREVLDSVDNRFGELMVNNNFWHKIGFQVAQLMLLSPGWDIGTVREIGGGLAEAPKSLEGLLKGKGVTDKTAYVAALLAVTAIQNGTATYLHTGQMPEGMDFFAYRTGGKNPDGSPERAIIPSYMKDIMALLFEGPGKMISNKVNPGLQDLYQLSQGKDYRGLPINSRLPGEKGLGDWTAEQVTPIGMENLQAKKGSQLSVPERLAGIRPAPNYLQNPDRQRGQADRRDLRAHRAKRKSDNKIASQLQ